MHITLLTKTLFLPLLTSTVVVKGYVGGACMGERLWSYSVPNYSSCISVDQFRQSDSIFASEFVSDNGWTFMRAGIARQIRCIRRWGRCVI